jgi:methyl-accepting chemotaxis protein
MRLPKTSISNLLWEQMLYVNLFVVLFIIVVFIFLAKRLFANLNGPLTKLRNEVRKISKGDLTNKVVLRSKDEFKDFAAELNTMTDELQSRFAKIKSITDQMASLVESEEQGADQVDALRIRLSQQSDELARELDSFQV